MSIARSSSFFNATIQKIWSNKLKPFAGKTKSVIDNWSILRSIVLLNTVGCLLNWETNQYDGQRNRLICMSVIPEHSPPFFSVSFMTTVILSHLICLHDFSLICLMLLTGERNGLCIGPKRQKKTEDMPPAKKNNGIVRSAPRAPVPLAWCCIKSFQRCR